VKNEEHSDTPTNLAAMRQMSETLAEMPPVARRPLGKVIDIGTVTLKRLANALADEFITLNGWLDQKPDAPEARKFDPNQLWLPFSHNIHADPALPHWEREDA